MSSEPTPSIPHPRETRLLGAGWFFTNFGFWLPELPLSLLLKEQLGMGKTEVSAFIALINIPNYFKPLAGMITDSVRLGGTRRKHYLVISLILAGLLWAATGFAPRQYGPLMVTLLVLYVFMVCVSTVLGGVMVDLGQKYMATGRLSSQRIAMIRIGMVLAAGLGGYLAKVDFLYTTLICAACHLVVAPLVVRYLDEPRSLAPRGPTLQPLATNLMSMLRAKHLWAAAGLILLVIAAPGFGTPLLYLQRDVLHFDSGFIGLLKALHNCFAAVAAVTYGFLCRRFALRQLLMGSIVLHSLASLAYLGYQSTASAIGITAIEGFAQVMAVLPLYDLAMRATPTGCEALGYSVLMSVWNLTDRLSDLAGSWLMETLHAGFSGLVFVNSGTTALVLIAVPFLPKALVTHREAGLARQAH